MSHLVKLNSLKAALLDKELGMERVNHISNMCYVRALVIRYFKQKPEYLQDFSADVYKYLDMWNEVAPFGIQNVIRKFEKIVNEIQAECLQGGYFSNYESSDEGEDLECFDARNCPEFMDLLTVLLKEMDKHHE